MQAGGDGIKMFGVITGPPEIAGAGALMSDIGLGIELLNNIATNGLNQKTATDAAVKGGIALIGGMVTDAAAAGVAKDLPDSKDIQAMIQVAGFAAEKGAEYTADMIRK